VKKNILIKAIVFSFLIIGVTSCRSKKNITTNKGFEATAVDRSNVIKTFEVSNLNYHTFSGRAKAKVIMNNATHDVSATVRIQKDKAIWISVTALLGIEVARILITPDSVKILNKLQSTYVAKPFSYLYAYASEGITFDVLQDMLVGNISANLLKTNQVQVVSSEDDMQILGIKNDLTFSYGLNKTQRPFLFRLIENGANQSLEVSYRDYATIDGHTFPQSFNLQATGDQVKLVANLEYSKLQFNETVELPFAVPSRYKIIH